MTLESKSIALDRNSLYRWIFPEETVPPQLSNEDVDS